MDVRRAPRPTRLVRASAAAALALALVAPLTSRAAADPGDHWVGTWGGSPAKTSDTANEQTYRDMVHTSVAGTTERVRLTNVFGTQPVTFGAAYLGLRGTGAAVAAGSNRQLTFAGSPQVTIPAGQETFSDPVDLAVEADRDLAVSLYVRGPAGSATQHTEAAKTSYFSAALSGDHAGDEGAAAFTNAVTSSFFCSGIDMLAPANVSTVVTLGDSITDGNGSTVDGDNRYPDVLARRLSQRAGGQDRSVVNAGIGANEVTQDRAPGSIFSQGGPAAIHRLDRDVLAQAGISHVIMLEGINDIGFGAPAFETGANAEQVIAGLRQIADRVHAKGLKIIGGTLTPYIGSFYGPAGELDRQKVNDWIRKSGTYDGVVDFDAVVRDPLFVAPEPERLNAPYDSGDHLHPNAAGYAAMANAIDLALLESDGAQPALPEAPYAVLLPIAALLAVASRLVRRRRVASPL